MKIMKQITFHVIVFEFHIKHVNTFVIFVTYVINDVLSFEVRTHQINNKVPNIIKLRYVVRICSHI